TSRDLFTSAKDLFIAAIGGGGHDEKEGARAGGGLGGVPVPAGASWQSGSSRNLGVRPFTALHHRVEPNGSLSLCPPPKTCSSAPKICSSLPCTEKAPTIKGRGKLAERIEVEFGPFRPAASR